MFKSFYTLAPSRNNSLNSDHLHTLKINTAAPYDYNLCCCLQFRGRLHSLGCPLTNSEVNTQYCQTNWHTQLVGTNPYQMNGQKHQFKNALTILFDAWYIWCMMQHLSWSYICEHTKSQPPTLLRSGLNFFSTHATNKTNGQSQILRQHAA